MAPGLIIVAATLLLTALVIYQGVRKAQAQKKAHQDRLDAARQALDDFAAAHQLDVAVPSVAEVCDYSFWATSAEGVRMAQGDLCGRQACLLVHAGGMAELAVLVACPEIPEGVSLAPAPTGRAQEDYYLGMAA